MKHIILVHRSTLLLFFLICFFSVEAQMISDTDQHSSEIKTKRTSAVICPSPSKKANFWYFGINAGINFNSGAPVAMTNGQLNTREGVSTLSDDNGNLLFYTDGISVWNRAHAVMATGLYGNPSSTQSGVIIQKPGNTNRYYIFTADIVLGSHGYNYSEVDMTLNGGLGGIIPATKNTSLFYNHTEKITATRHANGVDFWVVMHEANNSNFRAYLVSAAGVSTTPVISAAGAIANDAGDWNAAGYMKFSKDGKTLVNAFDGSLYRAELFDFNTTTGAITGPTTVLTPLSAAYGIEFSANAKYLYISELVRDPSYGSGYNNTGAIAQYDLKAGNAAAINASRTVLVSSATINYGALQMAPDGKIYVAKENGFNVGASYLGVINNPDAPGSSSNYVENGFYLAGKKTLIGLPNFITSDYNPSLTILGKDTVCLGDVETYTFTRSQNFNYDRAVLGAFVVASGDTTITLKFTSPGYDTIRIRSFPECPIVVTDTLIVRVLPSPTLSIGEDSTFCSNPFSYTLNAGSFSSYLWNTGSTASSITAATPGTYWVQVSNANNCVNRDSIVLNYSVPIINLKDTVICQQTPLLLQPGSFAHYLWQDHSTQPTFTVLNSGTYTLQATDANGCTANKSIDITFVPKPSVHLGEDSIFCSNPFFYTLNAGSFSSYLWNTGSTSSNIAATTPGTYWVEVYNEANCKNRDSITLRYSAPPIIDLKDTVICQHTTVLLQPGSFAHYLWQDNSTQPTFTALIPGTYTLHATNDDGCEADKSIDITLVPPFDIHIDDITHCPGTSETLDAGNGFDSYTWQDGSHNQTFNAPSAGEYSVTVTRSCESAQDTIKINDYTVVVPVISGLEPSYCVSHDNVALSATPTGGIFSGLGMVGNALHIKQLPIGMNRIVYSYVDLNGCTNRDTATTVINEDCFFIPNLITPNNDGQNDFFQVIGIGNNYTLEIYNRWGDLIYRKENYDNSFTGEGVSDGVYFFELTYPQRDKKYKGWLQIVDRK